jgi:hypothetical protein
LINTDEEFLKQGKMGVSSKAYPLFGRIKRVKEKNTLILARRGLR